LGQQVSTISMVISMNGKQNIEDDWQACPSGELTQMVGRLNARERRARFAQLASSGLMSMLLFAAGAILVGGFVIYQEPMFGGISCTDCLSHANEYHDHLLGSSPMADVELASQIETHLEECLCCRTKFGQAYPDIPMERLTQLDSPSHLLSPTFAIAFSSVGY
jgi:hypothetical protein